MPVLTASHPTTPLVPMRAIVYSLLFGVGFIAGGLVIGYFTFGTEFLTRFTVARPNATQMAAGALAWTFALIAPGVFLIVGMVKIVETIELISLRRRRARPATAVVASLPEDHIVAARVRLPDGRIVPEIVVGPFGAAVVEELPAADSSRHREGHWEVRLPNGRWVPIENPLDRATRDAERLRAWLTHEEQDHVVKVYATVVARTDTIPRSPTCAVTTPENLPGWLASLPPQRSLNADRQARIVALLREAMA